MEADGQTSRPSHVPYEKYREVLEEMSSLKMRALHREEEIQTLEAMLAGKDWETARLKDQLLLRDTTISKLRSLAELAWTEFDSANRTNINPQASAVEKHDEEESVQDINGTASIRVTNHHGNTATSAHVSSVQGEPPSLVSAFNGPQPPPTDAKTPRAFGPIISVSKSKGRPPPPPPPPRHPSPPPPLMEANILGATRSPVGAFNIAPRPPPPPPRMEANILGATRSPVNIAPRPPPPRMEANILGATPSPVGAFNIAPRPRPPPPPPPPRMEADIVGATRSPVRAFNIAPRPPPPPPRMEANILGATRSPVNIAPRPPPPRMEANILGATPSPVGV
ncbi:hypothetical protein DKX38_028521 [Salix brachista]|uniref:Uncharacterized protein n=1 Tax=Salix brachista TaxID=2182728 RepID=A0A5N5JAK9_9ROSI|nr:hypothetical protein DKX38_028521 [Salix brachista]